MLGGILPVFSLNFVKIWVVAAELVAVDNQ